MDKYQFYQINEHATNIQDDTGATGLKSVSQLEFIVIQRVKKECHR